MYADCVLRRCSFFFGVFERKEIKNTKKIKVFYNTVFFVAENIPSLGY